MKIWLLPFFLLLFSCRSRPPVHAGPPKMIHVEGHRGARAVYPEESLEAFDYALESGVDVLEMDLAVTADHQVVLAHDPFVNEQLCADPQGKKSWDRVLFKDLTLEQVKKITCGFKIHPRFPRQKKIKTQVATLSEVFDEVRNSKWPAAQTVRFNLEIKTFPDHPENTWDLNTFVSDVLRVIQASGFKERVVIQSFDFRALRRVREWEPSLPLAALTEDDVHPLKTLGDLKVEILSPNFKTIDLEIVEKAQKRGMKVVPWTVNDADDWEDMINLRVDGIISDDPAPLLNYLRKRGFHP